MSGSSHKRQRVSSGAIWESRVGYSRAVRVGDAVFVAGTTATDSEGKVVGRGDPYAQTIRVLQIIQDALAQVGATMEHVVRTRMFVADIAHWEEVGRAHGEFFLDIRPAATMVEVSGLIDPDMLVEIEADAVISDLPAR